jgi:pimeloyl-ACP methyl ester carboxylesterase
MLSYYKAGFPAPPYELDTATDASRFVYHVPSLIIWGLEDPFFSMAQLTRLWDWFSKSYRFVSIPRAGHWLHQDAPRQVNAELRSWLSSERWSDGA